MNRVLPLLPMTNTASRLGAAAVTAARRFGNPLPLVAATALVSTIRVTSAISMKIDDLTQTSLRDVQTNDPILLCGNPRSGTTFLHRFIADARIAHACTPYDFVFPAQCVQTALAPLKPMLTARFPSEKVSTPAHKIGLNLAEADDAALTLRYFDGFFASPILRGFNGRDSANLFVSEEDTFERDADFFEALWRRKRSTKPKLRVAAKLFSAAPRLEKFLGRFSRAQILYTVRDPLEMIPSGMSLNLSMLKKQFDFDSLPEHERSRYLDLLYRSFVAQLRSFHDVWTHSSEVKERTHILPFPRMMNEFEVAMNQALEFLRIDPSPFQHIITRTAATQRSYKSQHSYDLSRFGLSADTIRRDCAFLDPWLNE